MELKSHVGLKEEINISTLKSDMSQNVKNTKNKKTPRTDERIQQECRMRGILKNQLLKP